MKATKEFATGFLDAFVSMDLDNIMSFFGDDAVLIDPHYPKMEMKGKDEIRKGLEWGLSSMVKAGFEVEKCWVEGSEGVVKVKTNHEFKGNFKVDIMQIFLFEVNEDGKLKYLQSFVPYRPGGLPGFLTKVTGMFWK